MIQILSRKTKNNPILIGEPGVGKTAIVEGLAWRIFKNDVPVSLQNKIYKAIEISKKTNKIVWQNIIFALGVKIVVMILGAGIHTAYVGKWHLDGGDYFGLGRCPKGWDKAYWYDIKGMSHITGGGFYENVPRMLKEGQGVSIDLTTYPRKPIFDFIAKTGDIPMKEMCNVFNMGIGFIMAVDKNDVEKVQSLLSEIGEESYVIGEVTNSGSVDLTW